LVSNVYLCAWAPKVKIGGVFGGHDFVDMTLNCKDKSKVKFGVVEAVEEFVKESQ
jgi:hypothetical protein